MLLYLYILIGVLGGVLISGVIHNFKRTTIAMVMGSLVVTSLFTCDLMYEWNVRGLHGLISALQGFFVLGLVSVTHSWASHQAPLLSQVLVSGLIHSLSWLLTLF